MCLPRMSRLNCLYLDRNDLGNKIINQLGPILEKLRKLNALHLGHNGCSMDLKERLRSILGHIKNLSLV